MPDFLRLRFRKTEESMDIVFLLAAAVMFAALLGMVMGCDKLGAHK